MMKNDGKHSREETRAARPRQLPGVSCVRGGMRPRPELRSRVRL